MNRSVLMIMGGALIVAVIVAMIVQAKLSPSSGSSDVPTFQILVAKKNLNIGDKLKPADVRWETWPEKSFYKGMIKKDEKVDDKDLDVYDTPLRRAIASGEPVTRQALIEDIKGSNNFLAASIAPGMRAVAISVKAQTMAGGFISPGDHVDVVLSYTPQLPGDAKQYSEGLIQSYASQTVLSDVRVLAVDQASLTEDEHNAKVAKTVTLEVDREGAQVMALAERMGDITLALRRIGEKDKVSSEAFPLTTDATMSSVLRKLNTVKSQSQTNTNIIRMYSGSTVQNVPVRAGGGEPGGNP